MKMLEPTIDRPKMLGDSVARSQRIADLQAPHMKALRDFVVRLRQDIGDEASITLGLLGCLFTNGSTGAASVGKYPSHE